MSEEKITFSFGKNWLDYLGNLNPDRYEDAKKSLQELLNLESLSGKTFLDIGCGSGLFSLCAVELGAKEVISIDTDPDSVKSCLKLKTQCNVDHWKILNGSILDKTFTRSLDKFDIVYAWGVLHHTGKMWEAIKKAAELVTPEGILVMAIYNRTLSSRLWLKYKRLYNKSGKFLKTLLIWTIFLPRIMVRIIKLKHPLKEKRGMSIYYDAVDWAGGLPYEFAPFEKICSYVNRLGFTLLKGNRTESIGCNEFVFRQILK